MKISCDYAETIALFEETVTRASQLAAFAVVIHDSLDAESIDKKNLQDTLWLLGDLLKIQHKEIITLQEQYIKDHFSHGSE